MSLIDDFVMNKKLKDVGLMVSHNEKGHVFLYASLLGSDYGTKVILRKFGSRKSYERFLVRSVLALLCLKKTKTLDRVFDNLCATLVDMERSFDEKIHF